MQAAVMGCEAVPESDQFANTCLNPAFARRLLCLAAIVCDFPAPTIVCRASCRADPARNDRNARWQNSQSSWWESAQSRASGSAAAFIVMFWGLDVPVESPEKPVK